MLLFFTCNLWGQETKPLIQLKSFSFEGVGVEESRLIVSLVRSYLSDIGNVAETDGKNLKLAEAPPIIGNVSKPQPESDSIDYAVSGSIRMERDNHVLMLDITNAKTGETHTVSSTYKNSGEMALKTRSVLESAFSAGSLETERRPSARPERISESLITGTWKGEAGIEMIRLMQGGRGLAVFSSGAQMVLSYSIESNTLKIRQTSPNSERYYNPLPLDAAKQLARDAEPMTWELLLYQDGTLLGGTRVSTAARMSNGKVIELVHGADVREVFWNKTGN